MSERALIRLILVEQELVFGGTGLCATKIDTWSLEAVTLLPSVPNRVTRIGALLALGRLPEALACLDAVMDPAPSALNKIFLSAQLSATFARTGDQRQAEHWRRQLETNLDELPNHDIQTATRLIAERIIARYQNPGPETDTTFARFRVTQAGLMACLVLTAACLGIAVSNAHWAGHRDAIVAGTRIGFDDACKQFAFIAADYNRPGHDRADADRVWTEMRRTCLRFSASKP